MRFKNGKNVVCGAVKSETVIIVVTKPLYLSIVRFVRAYADDDFVGIGSTRKSQSVLRIFSKVYSRVFSRIFSRVPESKKRPATDVNQVLKQHQGCRQTHRRTDGTAQKIRPLV